MDTSVTGTTRSNVEILSNGLGMSVDEYLAFMRDALGPRTTSVQQTSGNSVVIGPRTLIEGLQYIKTLPCWGESLSIDGGLLLTIKDNTCIIRDSMLFKIITVYELYNLAEIFYGYRPEYSGDNRPHFKHKDYISLANFLDYIIGILINKGHKVTAPFM